jgi:hypothetical protein
MIDAAKTTGGFFPNGNDAGEEIQREDGWTVLALAPFTTGRDSDLMTDVNWSVVCEAISADGIRTGDVRVNNPFNGWNVSLYFDAGHEPTVDVIMDLCDRVEEDPCLDDARLAEEERCKIEEALRIQCVPNGVDLKELAREIRGLDAWDGWDNGFTDEMVRDALQEIHHDFDESADDLCLCGEPADARLHRDKEFVQIKGQFTLC